MQSRATFTVLREQVVFIEAFQVRSFPSGQWESMQTEHSYKYTQSEIEELAEK